MPKLSFVIPTHNRYEMLVAAISSVVEQTIDDWELIVVDDASDEPVEFCVNTKDERMTFYRNSNSHGAAASRNVGARLASSEFVAFLDDDDTFEPEYAAKMLAHFACHGEEIGFAWPALRVINMVERSEAVAQQHPCLIKAGSGTEDAFLASAYTRTTGMIFRKEVFVGHGGFDESLAVSEDRELVFRLLASGVGCASVPDRLVNFFVHSGPRLSTDANVQRQADCDTRVLARHEAFLLGHPKLASRYLNLVAKRQKLAGWRRSYEKTLKMLLRVRPLDLRAWRRLLISRLKR